MSERLHKIIAASGLMSRRQAEEMIRQGRVSVDGRVARLGESAEAGKVEIRVNGRVLGTLNSLVTVMLNKPVGYICTMNDPAGRPLVTDLLPSELGRLYPVGRLDFNTEGLLLLTNDGALAQHLMHPRHHVSKTYLVKVRGRLDGHKRAALESGVVLDDGPTCPAQVTALRTSGHNCWFELTLHEGRNRQVRRMCEAVGLTVVRLKRIAVGKLTLGELPRGAWRKLTPGELHGLKQDAGANKDLAG